MWIDRICIFVSAAFFDACFLLVLIINFRYSLWIALYTQHTCIRCKIKATTIVCLCVLLLKDLSLLFHLLENFSSNFLLLCLFIVCYPLSKIILCTHQWFRLCSFVQKIRSEKKVDKKPFIFFSSILTNHFVYL